MKVFAFMDEQGHRKIPPDRPSDALVCGSKKKIKETISESQVNDTIMGDGKVPEVDGTNGVHTDQTDGAKKCSHEEKGKSGSYKESLLGFNGVANGWQDMEEEDLLTDVFDKEWEMPEMSEEIKELMKQYPVVPIDPEEYSEWCKPWNKTLIITVLGRKMNVHSLKDRLGRIWGFMDFDLIDIPNNYFIVKFPDKEGWTERYKRVLYEGPWVVQHHCVMVQQWSANFDPFNNTLRKVVSWVRIPHIPMQCYNKQFITRLGNRIGKTLRVDLNTLAESSSESMKVERGRYARICVELDLQKQLVPRVIAANAVYNVVYEGLNVICFSCGRYGHRKENCPYTPKGTDEAQNGVKKGSSQEASTPKVVTPTGAPMDVTGRFGTWMLVDNNHKVKVGKKDSRDSKGYQGKGGFPVKKEKGETSKSRFDVLADLETCEEEERLVSYADYMQEESDIQTAVLSDSMKNEGKNKGVLSVSGAGVPRNQKTKSGAPTEKGGFKVRGKENFQSSGAGFKNKAQKKVDEALRGKEAQVNRDQIVVSQRKVSMGQRSHVVVSGSVGSVEPKILRGPCGSPNLQVFGDQVAEGGASHINHGKAETRLNSQDTGDPDWCYR